MSHRSPSPVPCLRRLANPLALLLVLLAGCARLVVRGALPGDASPVELGPVDEAAPFAVTPDGARLARVSGGSTLVHGLGEPPRAVGGLPRALAWSPDGARLAAAFASASGSRLALFDATGAPLAEAEVPGRVDSLAFTAGGELVAGVARVERYGFGVSREESLARWGGEETPRLVPLGTTTIAPVEASRLGELVERGPLVAVAPQGDAVAYTRLHDPPMFPPFVGVEVRHLAGEAQREIGRAALDVRALAWSHDGEAVWFGDQVGLVRQPAWRPAATREAGATHVSGVPGRTPARSPRGTWLFSDARVLRGEQELVAFTPDAAAQFTEAGLVLRVGGRLLRLPGFAEPAPEPLPEARRTRLRELRLERAEGRLSPADFDARLAAPEP